LIGIERPANALRSRRRDHDVTLIAFDLIE
jgi:hypothetical protein